MKNEWQERSLGDILRLEYGKPLGEFDRKSNGRFPVYGANGEKDRTDKFYHDKPSIIVGRKGSAGEINLTEKKFWPLDVTYFVTFDEKQHDLRFLYYLLTTLELNKLAKGVKPGINRKEVYSQLTRVPPLLEQQRVVVLLDEALDAISTAKANAEKNLQNARGLFGSTFGSIVTGSGQDSWTRTSVANVALPEQGSIRTGPFGSQLLHSEFVKEGIAVLGIDNVVANEFRWGRNRCITPEKYEQLARYRVRPGDVLITIMGTCGRCAIVPADIPKAINTKHLCCITLDHTKCLPGFLHAYFLNHPIALDFLAKRAKGSIMAGLNMGIIAELPVLLPTIGRQKTIIAQLDSLRSETKRLESLYQRKVAALDELKKSLLHKAFAGELITRPLRSVVNPFPEAISNITTTDLHAGVLAMAWQLHEQRGRPQHFTHVKAEKIAHMIEARLGIDLGRAPIKDAAGPNDFPHLRKVEHRAKKTKSFDFKQVEGGAYKVHKLSGFEQLIKRARVALGDRCGDVERLLEWTLPMNVKQAEIVATVFAAWNNLLLDGKQPSDEQIVTESRENWHPNKLKIDRKKFFSAVQWLREQGVVPEGKGRRVEDKRK